MEIFFKDTAKAYHDAVVGGSLDNLLETARTQPGYVGYVRTTDTEGLTDWITLETGKEYWVVESALGVQTGLSFPTSTHNVKQKNGTTKTGVPGRMSYIYVPEAGESIKMSASGYNGIYKDADGKEYNATKSLLVQFNNTSNLRPFRIRKVINGTSESTYSVGTGSAARTFTVKPGSITFYVFSSKAYLDAYMADPSVTLKVGENGFVGEMVTQADDATHTGGGWTNELMLLKGREYWIYEAKLSGPNSGLMRTSNLHTITTVNGTNYSVTGHVGYVYIPTNDEAVTIDFGGTTRAASGTTDDTAEVSLEYPNLKYYRPLQIQKTNGGVAVTGQGIGEGITFFVFSNYAKAKEVSIALGKGEDVNLTVGSGYYLGSVTTDSNGLTNQIPVPKVKDIWVVEASVPADSGMTMPTGTGTATVDGYTYGTHSVTTHSGTTYTDAPANVFTIYSPAANSVLNLEVENPLATYDPCTFRIRKYTQSYTRTPGTYSQLWNNTFTVGETTYSAIGAEFRVYRSMEDALMDTEAGLRVIIIPTRSRCRRTPSITSESSEQKG